MPQVAIWMTGTRNRNVQQLYIEVYYLYCIILVQRVTNACVILWFFFRFIFSKSWMSLACTNSISNSLKLSLFLTEKIDILTIERSSFYSSYLCSLSVCVCVLVTRFNIYKAIISI